MPSTQKRRKVTFIMYPKSAFDNLLGQGLMKRTIIFCLLPRLNWRRLSNARKLPIVCNGRVLNNLCSWTGEPQAIEAFGPGHLERNQVLIADLDWRIGDQDPGGRREGARSLQHESRRRHRPEDQQY